MPRSTSTCRISDARTEAQIRVDRAAAIATTLTDRHAAAIEREAQAVKLQPYEAATRWAAAMREAIVELYPAAAQAIVDILRALAETEFEVAAANADLPTGMPKIPVVEMALRAIPGFPPAGGERDRRTPVVLSGDNDPKAIGQEHVKLRPGGRVVLRHSRGGVEFLVRRKFIRREHSAFVAAEVPDRLAIAINLPGIGAKDPACYSPLRRHGITDAEAVLRHLGRPVAVSSLSSTPKGKVEWRPVDLIDAEAERHHCATILDRIAGRG